MYYNGYEITHFRTELLDGVLDLLSNLWGDDYELNRAYFQWKYIKNPYPKNPLGIVALHKGKVVGFRGSFATCWKISKTEKKLLFSAPVISMLILHIDACIWP